MKEIVTWQIQVRVGKNWRKSPEYRTPEEACAMLLPFVKKLQQRFTCCTVIRNVRYMAEVEKA